MPRSDPYDFGRRDFDYMEREPIYPVGSGIGLTVGLLLLVAACIAILMFGRNEPTVGTRPGLNAPITQPVTPTTPSPARPTLPNR
jgi:hypothetical protein